MALTELPDDAWQIVNRDRVHALITNGPEGNLIEALGSLLSASPAQADTPDTARIGQRAEATTQRYLSSAGFRNIVAVQNGSGHGFDIVATFEGRVIIIEVKGSGNSVYRSLSELQNNFDAYLADVRARLAGRQDLSRRAQTALRRIDRELAEGRRPLGLYAGFAAVGTREQSVSIEWWTSEGRVSPPIQRGPMARVTRSRARMFRRAFRRALREEMQDVVP